MPIAGSLIKLRGCNKVGVIVANKARAVKTIRPFRFDDIPQAIPRGYEILV